MTLALEVFDVFGHIIPGSLYLGCILYVMDRLDWIEFGVLWRQDVVVVVIAGAMISYILGHATYDIVRLAAYRLPRSSREDLSAAAIEQLIARFPPAADMSIVDTHPLVLASMVEAQNPDLKAKIDKHRATAIMLRGCAGALALASLIAFLELVVARQLVAGLAGIFMVMLSALLLRRSRTVARWSYSKTFESALALPEIEGMIESFKSRGHAQDRTLKPDAENSSWR